MTIEHLRHLVLGMALRFKEFRQPLPVPALQLRYEDFVTDMAAHARRLGSLLEVELDASAVASNSDVMARHMTAETVGTLIGRWRGELSTSEVSYIERRLGASMRDFGYV